jgi:hypothetical protein
MPSAIAQGKGRVLYSDHYTPGNSTTPLKWERIRIPYSLRTELQCVQEAKGASNCRTYNGRVNLNVLWNFMGQKKITHHIVTRKNRIEERQDRRA